MLWVIAIGMLTPLHPSDCYKVGYCSSTLHQDDLLYRICYHNYSLMWLFISVAQQWSVSVAKIPCLYCVTSITMKMPISSWLLKLNELSQEDTDTSWLMLDQQTVWGLLSEVNRNCCYDSIIVSCDMQCTLAAAACFLYGELYQDNVSWHGWQLLLCGFIC